ncbi:MAG: DUF4878 domain-containing protein [Chitinophagaceae bacterium]|nr:DUF4878 domain-containing protein [Chitinophagaceae bacterium]MCW5904720.1 DUF4878 domain-containing protein [Chitinophagaceae bacterium]
MKCKLLFCIIIFSACTSQHYTPATSAIEAITAFMEACKLGDFKKANFYMLQDEENKKLLKEAQNKFYQYDLEEKRQLASASLQNISIENLSATEVIIYYNNSSDKERRKVKAILNNNTWLIDFKYTFNPNL